MGWSLDWLHRHLDDAPIEITITSLTPFAAYLLAEAAHVSGVLVTLSAGLYLSRHSSRFFSSRTRLQANAVWNVLVFVLDGLLFLLMGLQLRRLDRITRWHLPGCGIGTPAVDPGGAALSGTRPPHRADRSRVILATLVGQGLSLIRLLGITSDGTPEQERQQAQHVAAQAALTRLQELAGQEWVPEALLVNLRAHYEEKAKHAAEHLVNAPRSEQIWPSNVKRCPQS